MLLNTGPWYDPIEKDSSRAIKVASKECRHAPLYPPRFVYFSLLTLSHFVTYTPRKLISRNRPITGR